MMPMTPMKKPTTLASQTANRAKPRSSSSAIPPPAADAPKVSCIKTNDTSPVIRLAISTATNLRGDFEATRDGCGNGEGPKGASWSVHASPSKYRRIFAPLGSGYHPGCGFGGGGDATFPMLSARSSTAASRFGPALNGGGRDGQRIRGRTEPFGSESVCCVSRAVCVGADNRLL